MDMRTLCERYQSGKKLKYLFFWGHKNNHTDYITKSCLSQWYPVPFIVNNVSYSSAEHYMMAEKARLFNDSATLEKLSMLKTQVQRKRMGARFVGLTNRFGMNIDWRS